MTNALRQFRTPSDLGTLRWSYLIPSYLYFQVCDIVRPYKGRWAVTGGG